MYVSICLWPQFLTICLSSPMVFPDISQQVANQLDHFGDDVQTNASDLEMGHLEMETFR